MKSSHPTPETIRVKDLKINDRFKMFGVDYEVFDINDEGIIYGNYGLKDGAYFKRRVGVLGRNSEELVERILGPATTL